MRTSHSPATRVATLRARPASLQLSRGSSGHLSYYRQKARSPSKASRLTHYSQTSQGSSGHLRQAQGEGSPARPLPPLSNKQERIIRKNSCPAVTTCAAANHCWKKGEAGAGADIVALHTLPASAVRKPRSRAEPRRHHCFETATEEPARSNVV